MLENTTGSPQIQVTLSASILRRERGAEGQGPRSSGLAGGVPCVRLRFTGSSQSLLGTAVAVAGTGNTRTWLCPEGTVACADVLGGSS